MRKLVLQVSDGALAGVVFGRSPAAAGPTATRITDSGADDIRLAISGPNAVRQPWDSGTDDACNGGTWEIHLTH